MGAAALMAATAASVISESTVVCYHMLRFTGYSRDTRRGSSPVHTDGK